MNNRRCILLLNGALVIALILAACAPAPPVGPTTAAPRVAAQPTEAPAAVAPTHPQTSPTEVSTEPPALPTEVPTHPPAPPSPSAPAGQLKLSIVSPRTGQIVWGTIIVVATINDPAASDVAFAYDGGAGLVDFAVDDGTVTDSDLVLTTRLGTWDTLGLSPGQYVVQARALDVNGQPVTTAWIAVTVAPEPQVQVNVEQTQGVESGKGILQLLLSASEKTAPSDYGLIYRWTLASGASVPTGEGEKLELSAEDFPACHQALLKEYQSLYSELPDQLGELVPVVDQIRNGPCVQPISLSFSNIGGSTGYQDLLLCIGQGCPTQLAFVGAQPLLGPAFIVRTAYASDVTRIDALRRQAESIYAVVKKAPIDFLLTMNEEEDVIWAQADLLWAEASLERAEQSLAQGEPGLAKAVENVAQVREHLRRAADNVHNIAKLKKQGYELDLAAAGATAAWGRLRLTQLIGEDEAKRITSPIVAVQEQYTKADGTMKTMTNSHYANGGTHSTDFCMQFLAIQLSDWRDDDVILHEFGHHTMYKATKRRGPGGDHSFNKACAGDKGELLAWSEGWATFVEAALQGHSTYTDKEPGKPDLVRNLEKNADTGGGPRVEGAVAGILWDLYDGSDGVKDDDKDGVSIAFKDIWQAMRATLTDKSLGRTGIMKVFYDKIIKIVDLKKADKKTIETIFNNHGVKVAYFGPIRFAEGIVNGKPVNPHKPGDKFKSGTAEVYAFFDASNVVKGLKWKSEWRLDGNLLKDVGGSDTWNAGESEKDWWVRLRNLVPGRYELRLYIEGELVQSGTFVVEK